MSPETAHGELKVALEAERECCGRLGEVVRREREAVVSHDLAALLAALREREALQAEWLRLAARRRALLPAASAGDPEVASRIAAVARRAAEVRREQRVNEGLLRTALGNVSGLLLALEAALPGARYDERAGLAGRRGWGGAVERRV